NAAGSGSAAITAATPFVFTPAVTAGGTTVAGSTVTGGGQITVTAAGLPKGATVTIDLHSDPIRLATVTIGEDGVLSTTVTIPATAPAGKHQLVLTITGAGTQTQTVAYDLTV